eukprot:2190587-Heterocapsa_arctica.AAC.1
MSVVGFKRFRGFKAVGAGPRYHHRMRNNICEPETSNGLHTTKRKRITQKRKQITKNVTRSLTDVSGSLKGANGSRA